MESLFAVLVDLLLIGLGIVNMRGNISTIHWYHRTRIREEDKLPYGKWVGGGTVVIGCGVACAALLELLIAWESAELIVLPALIIGFSMILYAQFKYNGGLF